MSGHHGSSPRARGADYGANAFQQFGRFIPTCAGSSQTSTALGGMPTVHPHVPTCAGSSPDRQRSVCPPAAHPHVRGEQEDKDILVYVINGSSPRARGAVHTPTRPHAGVRFIPACAGSSNDANGAKAPDTVHPRVRGEQKRQQPPSLLSVGSSPRARGAGLWRWGSSQPVRFIPTGAGSGWRSRQSSWPRTVHPRVRGE